MMLQAVKGTLWVKSLQGQSVHAISLLCHAVSGRKVWGCVGCERCCVLRSVGASFGGCVRAGRAGE